MEKSIISDATPKHSSRTQPARHAETRMGCAILFLYVLTQLLVNMSSVTSGVPLLRDHQVGPAMTLVTASIALLVLSRRRGATAGGAAVCAFALSAMLLSYTREPVNMLVLGAVVFFAVYGLDTRSLLETYFLSVSLMIVATLALSLSGVLPNIGIVPNTRLVFLNGFDHPNAMGQLLLQSLLCLVFIRWQRSWQLVTLLGVAYGVFSYFVLSSHTNCALCLFVAVANAVGHLFRRWGCALARSRVAGLVIAVLPAALILVMNFGVVCYDSNAGWMKLLDGLTHGRLSFGHEYFVQCGGFTVLGREYYVHPSFLNGETFLSVDSVYTYLPVVYGLAVTVVLALLYVRGVRLLPLGEYRYCALLALFVALLCGVTNKSPLYLYADSALLLLCGDSSGLDDPKDDETAPSNAPRATGIAVACVGAVIVGLVAATVFWRQHCFLDSRAMVGRLSLAVDGEDVLQLVVDGDMHARASYREREAEGKLAMKSATADTVVYVIGDPEFGTRSSGDGSTIYIEVPSSGMRGDKVGEWRIRAVGNGDEDQGEADWLALDEGGCGAYGHSTDVNPILAQRETLLLKSEEITWVGGADRIAVACDSKESPNGV